ncbi:3-deoxy-D-manno-octulosonic acid transferase [Pseudaestuariivita rosea]|uniref:3-deoxy-D-manno-octulosonic acid transferase n=1 Tax=Pseudaestuariivita rosea TaxID=2763263 RepID=UPI001ABB2A87|nr:glycosyltransferase N-terminal domain-containing protein [Pseudaestuariivita rosea]
MAHPADHLDKSENLTSGAALSTKAEGPLIWLQASEAPDALAMCELAARLRLERDDARFLLTVPQTLVLPSDDRFQIVTVQPLPPETPQAVEIFLKIWKPDLLIWCNGELRHVLLEKFAQQSVPMFLINLTTGAADSSNLKWMLGFQHDTLQHFQQIFAADREAEAMAKRLGARSDRVTITPMIQEGTPALVCDDEERIHLSAKLSNRPVWLAAYASEKEIELITQAHRRACRTAHRLLLILVPDDLSAGSDIASMLQGQGWSVATRSNGEEPWEATQIYLADTKDEMGLWYRLAPITFIGCSLAHGPGHNPLEPAALGSAVIHGPNIARYRHSYQRLAQAEAARTVRSADQLAGAVEYLISPNNAAKMAHGAWDVISDAAEATDHLIEISLLALDDQGV